MGKTPTLRRVAAIATRVLIASADRRVRSALMEVTSRHGDLAVVGFIRSEEHVLHRTTVSAPEVLLLDIRLLVDGKAEVVRELAHSLPHLKILIFGVDRTELAQHRELRGADLAPNLSIVRTGEHDRYRNLEAALDAAACSVTGTLALVAEPPPSVPLKTLLRQGSVPKPVPKLLVIAASTGGPTALMTQLKMLPIDFPLPIAVVQHMPPNFTTTLAARLNDSCALEVVEGEPGMEVLPGRIIIGPGDFHMKLRRSNGRCVVELDSGERECSCRPAANVLFRSAAELFGGSVLTVVLTGMGKDGLDGVRHLRERGARIIVQDAETSTVWGMPGAIAQAGIADAIVPLHQIANEVMRSL